MDRKEAIESFIDNVNQGILDQNLNQVRCTALDKDNNHAMFGLTGTPARALKFAIDLTQSNPYVLIAFDMAKDGDDGLELPEVVVICEFDAERGSEITDAWRIGVIEYDLDTYEIRSLVWDNEHWTSEAMEIIQQAGD